MMRWSFWRAVALLTSLFSLVMAVIFLANQDRFSAIDAPPRASATPPLLDLTPLQPLANTDPEQIGQEDTAILSRPVFDPTRRPFVPPPPAPPPPPPEPPVAVPQIVAEPPPAPPPEPLVVVPQIVTELPPVQPPAQQEVVIVAPPAKLDPAGLQLKGTSIAQGTAKALILSPEFPNGKWLEEGEKVSGWTIRDIKATAVDIAAPEQAATLELYVDNPSAN